MSQDQSPVVVEFGPASGPPDTPEARRPALSRLLAGARLDDRTVPALAGLGAVATFVSLVSPWQVTTVDIGELGPGQAQDVNAGVTDLGSWGPAYLLGVLAVAACTALVLFGAAAVRRHARLAGLGVTGALFAMVVAVAVELSRNSLVYPIYYLGPDPALSARSGLYLAFVGVAALGVALFFAGRLPAPAGAAEPAGGSTEEAGEEDVRWRWRRARAEPDPDEPPPPADLTVSPVTPFLHNGGR